MKDTAMQARSPGGVGGKRALGKAVAKGGLLLKGKNPGNVRTAVPLEREVGVAFIDRFCECRSNDRKMTYGLGCRRLRMCSGKLSLTLKQYVKSILTFSYLGFSV